MVGREQREVLVPPHREVEVAEEILQQPIELQHVVVRQARLGAVGVVDVVVAREAHHEDVRRCVAPQLLPGDRRARKGEREVVAEGRGQDRLVEGRPGLVRRPPWAACRLAYHFCSSGSDFA
jgi:hypothetical protein